MSVRANQRKHQPPAVYAPIHEAQKPQLMKKLAPQANKKRKPATSRAKAKAEGAGKSPRAVAVPAVVVEPPPPPPAPLAWQQPPWEEQVVGTATMHPLSVCD